MFYYLTGKIALMDANLAVVDCGGVGYACHTSNYTLSQLRVGQEHRLYTYCNIREDAFDIFGFASRDELRCFELLLGVTGVGAKAALAILSVVSPDGLSLAVMTEDTKTITMAQGVGKKLAQRIILELKDKLGADVSDSTQGQAFAAQRDAQGGKVGLASAALIELGYSQQDVAAALKGLPVDTLSVEEIVRQALRAMVMA